MVDDRDRHPFFFFNATATTEIYTRKDTLSLHDALPIWSSSADRNSRPPQPTRYRCTTSAAPSAITTETGTYKAYSAVLRIDSQVSGSWTIARKFASGSAR